MLIIKQMIMYDASKTWTSTRMDQILLNTRERKVLHKIFGADENNEWAIKTNAELKVLYNAPDIKVRRLR